VAVSEFAHEVSERVEEARQSLAEAEATGDDYLVGVRVGELESLARLAADHDIEVPGLAEDVARHGAPDEIRLPADDPATQPQH
jgi:hypothetical protein